MKRQTMGLLGAAIALGALLVLGATVAFAGSGSSGRLFGRMTGGSGPGGMMNGSGNSGMMNGSGRGGMMNGNTGQGMMRGFSGMMSSWTVGSTSGKTISLDQARKNVQSYIAGFNNPNLAIDEVIEFQRNFYAIIKDTSTGHGAMEVLVNKSTGVVFPEFGPAMMWNTEYGMMTGGMGRMMGYQQPSGPMKVSSGQAAEIARQWLEKNKTGATAESPDQFPGYYTLHFQQGGKLAGMLSVNGYSGQVWYHIWHGEFIN